MAEKFITGIDLGSSSIKIAVSSLNKDGNLQVIAVAEESSEGINKGIITNLEEAVSSLSRTLEKAERITGLNLTHAFVGITGTYIISQNSRGVVAVANARGEIQEDDVERVLEAAQAVATPPNYEILHVIPFSFTVDSQPGIKDPVGMIGVRLEVEAQIIQALSNQIKNLTKCLARVGITCDSLIFSILATAEAVLERREKELGVAVLNIGATTASLIVFEEGDILLTKVLPIGARHVTSDIAIGLKISVDLAESVKLLYGTALPDEVFKDEKIDLSEIDEKEKGIFSKREIAEIIEARYEEIFKMIDKELNSIKRSGRLPAGVVITGGGAKIKGLESLAKKILKLPVRIGLPKNVILTMQKAEDPIFTTAIGLTIWGKEIAVLTKKPSFSLKEKIQNFFKKFSF